MKIEFDTVREILEATKDECLRPVDDSILLKDINDKMFNFGVLHLFHVFLMKMYETEEIAKKVTE